MNHDVFTLRSAAGLPMEPPSLAAATVVVIDAQVEYVEGRLRLPDVATATARIASLLAAARAAGAPIVHVAHVGSPGGMFDPASTGAIIADVAPLADEPVVEKRLPNSFAGTNLSSLLTGFGADRPLVIAGFMTHMCVSATTRAALDLGHASTVVGDACATRNLPSATGGAPLSAATVHEAALAALADRFAAVVSTAAIVGA